MVQILFVRSYLVLLLMRCLMVFSEEPSLKTTGQKLKKITFSQPDLDEEEKHFRHIPSKLTCESCRGIAYQVASRIWDIHSTKALKGKLLTEADLLDLIGNICDSENFKNYGVKSVDGKNKLSGPGLPANDEPGMTMAGGIWASRLSTRCSESMGELDEYDLYKHIVKHRGAVEPVFAMMCLNEDNERLHVCGKGNLELLEPGNWKDGLGKSYTLEDVQEEFNMPAEGDPEEKPDVHDEL